MSLQLSLLDSSYTGEVVPQIVKRKKNKKVVKEFFEIRSTIDPGIFFSQTSLSQSKQKDIESLLKIHKDLFVFGKTGSGKTKVLNASVNQLLLYGVKTLYLSAIELRGHLNVSLVGNGLKQLSDYYNSYDYIVIDDFESILGDEKAIFELCYFIDHIYKNLMIFASCVDLKSIKVSSKKLSLRLSKFVEFNMKDRVVSPSQQRHQENCDKASKKVAEYFSLNQSDLKLKSRKRQYRLPRQIAWYFMHNDHGLSYSSIAKNFNMNHTTVMHGVKKIGTLKAKEKSFANKLKNILK